MTPLRNLLLLSVLLLLSCNNSEFTSDDRRQDFLGKLTSNQLQGIVIKRHGCSFNIIDEKLILEFQSSLTNSVSFVDFVTITQTNIAGSNFIGGDSFSIEFRSKNKKTIETAAQLFTFGLALDASSNRILADSDYQPILFSANQRNLPLIAKAIESHLSECPNFFEISLSGNDLVVKKLGKR